MKWAIEIQKFSLEKRNLSELLQGIGFELVDGVEYPALYSPAIEACETPEKVLEIAKRVRNAFICLSKNNDDFILGAVIDFSEFPPSRHSFFDPINISLEISVTAPSLTLSPPKGITHAELERWNAKQTEKQYQDKFEYQRMLFESAYLHPDAGKVIELLSIENPNGYVLNDIYEIIKGKKDFKTFKKELEINEYSFRRFKDAINSPLASGDKARHRIHTHYNSDDNPMTMAEAKDFIHDIAIKWLKSIRQNYSATEGN